MEKEVTWFEYKAAVSDILEDEQVKSMEMYRHHHFVTCYEHSVFVSYVSYCMAKRLGLDEIAAARGGLLHDFYLYDSENPEEYEGLNALYHPPKALENAQKAFSLSKKEENIIISHMWPIAKVAPKSKEAAVVCFADKVCAVLEFFKIWHRMKMAVRTKSVMGGTD